MRTRSFLSLCRHFATLAFGAVSMFGSPALAADSTPSTQAAPEKTADTKAPEKAEDSKPALSEEDLIIQSRIAMEQINATKEKSFRSKAALADLKAQTVASDFGQNSALITVVHRNELDARLSLVGAVYTLDGTPLFSRVDGSNYLDKIGEQTVFSARILPGPHVLAVEYELRGRGGLFSALDNELVTIRQKYSFKMEPRRATTIASTVFNTGTKSRALKEQPEVAFSQRGVREAKDEAAKPASESAPADPATTTATP